MARVTGFLRDRRAAATSPVAVMVAIVTIGAGAIITDHVWLVDQRDTLKAAANAAGIASTLEMREVIAGDPNIEDDDLKAAVEPAATAYVLANLLHLSQDRYERAKDTVAIEVLPDRDQGTVRVNVRADLGGHLFASMLPFLAGVPEIETMATKAEVVATKNPVEVVLAVDVSESMQNGLDGRSTFGLRDSRMDIVKRTALDLVSILNPGGSARD